MSKKYIDLYNHLKSELKLEDSAKRREVLVSTMENLKSSGVNCQSCTGCCCTFISNSMQTDPVQTLELYIFLKDQSMWSQELVDELKLVVKNNRLDYEISTGAGSSFRRTYTCPFYNKGPKGCSIDPMSKPYGCLAFNAKSSGVTNGEDCGSNIDLLKIREDKFEKKEDMVNEYIKEELDLSWDKLPMPVALLKMNELFEDSYE